MKRIEAIANDWFMEKLKEPEFSFETDPQRVFDYADGIRKGIELVQELDHWAFDEGGSDYISAMEIGLLRLSLDEELKEEES